MKSGADLTRLREISAEQASLIYRLVELKREENGINARYPSVPVTEEVAERRKQISEQRAEVTRASVTARWRKRNEEKEEKAKPRLRYFQSGRA